MTKILVVGDSITFGAGLALENNDPRLWVNQLVAQTFTQYKLTNLAEIGRNNQWIFNESASELLTNDYDIAIIGWSEISRFNFDIGLELYKTTSMLNDMDININNGVCVSGKWLEETGNRLRRYYNDHWAILDLIKYVNILYNIQVGCKNKKIFFVNTLALWTQNYFEYTNFSFPNELSEFQQQMLNVDTRDDLEIKKLYNMTHQHYKKYGGIRNECWLNLYHPLHTLKVDQVSSTDAHPGYASQDIFVKHLLPELHARM